MKRINWMNPETTAVVIGFSVGLGLAVHHIFFVPALLVVLVVAVEWTLEKMHECVHDLHLRTRSP